MTWEKDDLLNDFFDGVFFQLHGHLMEKLGYANNLTVAHAMMQMPLELKNLVALVKDVASKNRELSHVCNERQKVIEGLKRTCDERLALIERFNDLPGAKLAKKFALFLNNSFIHK